MNIQLLVVLRRQFSNPAPTLLTLLSVYHDLDTNQDKPDITRRERPPFRELNRLSEHQIDELVVAYESGDTARELGQQLGLSRQTISRYLQARDVMIRHHPMDPDQAAEAIRLYQLGWSLARVGEELCRPPTAIRDVLERAGIPRRDTHGRARLQA